MIGYIKGSLELKTGEYVIIETNGVGYKIFMSAPSMERLGEIGQKVKVFTYMRVREDDVSLYGFCSNEELRMFELLLSVSGIGAKSAISILSAISPSIFALAVISDDLGKLKKLPGVGAKSAQRIILELKDKLKTQEAMEETSDAMAVEYLTQENQEVAEAVSALQVLGYTRKECDTALEKIDVKGRSVEEIIKIALKNLAR